MKNLKNLFKKDKLTVYTSENCNYCKETKEKLKENNIEFIEKSITNYENEWKDIVNLTNMPVTPCVYYKDQYLFPARDFANVEMLVQVLTNLQPDTSDKQAQLVEKLKTLNYHVNMAFGRLDQKLRAIESKLQDNNNKKEKDDKD